ncbi:MAG TPA: threonine/serine dehydratase [Nitrospirota bacterium]|nr:threonine/serine dehydratase [Nitrospirota bacterium]
MDKTNITIRDVISARKFLEQYDVKTPLRFNTILSQETGAEIYIKHENFNLSGAFKIRAALYYVGTLPEVDRKKGLIAVTRGNHGAALAIAGKRFCTSVTVVVPVGNSIGKNRLIKSYGAELVEYGKDYDEAKEHCEKLAAETGKVYVHTANIPGIIAAAGTCAYEVFEELSDPDVLIVPIGSGGLISGTAIVRNAINPSTKIIGVQAEKANAVYRSLKEGRTVQLESCDTIADGLATRSVFELPFSIIKNNVNEVVTVSEEEIKAAICRGIESTHSLIEGASASTIAALGKVSSYLKGMKVVLFITGANIDKEILSAAVNA